MFLSHVGKSAYFLQLERWIRLFGREHVKVCGVLLFSCCWFFLPDVCLEDQSDAGSETASLLRLM